MNDKFSIIAGEDFLARPIEGVSAVVNPHIPTGGITLLFGPPGAGKTALNWALGNVMAVGEDFLGHSTTPGRVLFISLDMNERLCHIRMDNSGFKPKFDLAFGEMVDCLAASRFKASNFYKGIKRQINKVQYSLIIIDALGWLGKFEMNNDNVPSQVYGSLQELLTDQTILLNHHSRKQKHDREGIAIAKTMEDAFGSQFWTAYAASVMQLQKTGEQTGKLVHSKSQVFELAEPIAVYVNHEGSTLSLLEDRKVKTATSRLEQWEKIAKDQHPNWDDLGTEEKVHIFMGISGRSRKTIYRHMATLKGTSVAGVTTIPS